MVLSIGGPSDSGRLVHRLDVSYNKGAVKHGLMAS
jgi:hypothetical protein